MAWLVYHSAPCPPGKVSDGIEAKQVLKDIAEHELGRLQNIAAVEQGANETWERPKRLLLIFRYEIKEV